MALEIKQQLKLSQQLIMTPQLQQAIKLLQLSRLELLETLHQEIEANPILEESAGEEQEYGPSEGTSEEPAPEAEAPVGEVAISERALEDMDWDNYLNDYSSPRHEGGGEDRELPSFENILSRKTSLNDHLLWQLSLSNLSPEDQRIGEELIGNLDKNGYLTVTVDDIAAAVPADQARVAETLRRIQEFDPPGVAARDLKECLLIQARTLYGSPPWVEEILENHMGYLENKNYAGLAKVLQAPPEEIGQAVQLILHLDPKPGRAFSIEEPQYISPDIFVYKVGEEYIIVLNDDGLPRLRINSFYRQALSRKNDVPEGTRDYIQEKLRSALWLIKSIQQRQRTIYRVTESIFKFQRPFLDYGISHLKPLILRDVAEDVQMHESTISRVTTNKYVYTPQGIYELKYFFNSSLPGANGETVASESVKEKIRQLIAREDPRRPLSDQEITELLQKEKIHIARRTVAKYRELLTILPSSKRRNPNFVPPPSPPSPAASGPEEEEDLLDE
ncbi:MAG: RNA polymerase factor sigma-54 [Desulfobacterota bacterium]|nr:RNA polymerase factor sigma-54 [Thermodesulfobacteriota bacterium]